MIDIDHEFISTTELRRKFHYYLRLVEAGQRLIITKRGIPVAVMIPYGEYESLKRANGTKK